MSTETSTTVRPEETGTTEKQEGTTEEQPRLRVALALSGRQFGRPFLLSLLSCMHTLWESQKVQIILSPGFDLNSTHQRMRSWGLNPQRGVSRIPLDGAFDVLVSLGPDAVFRPEQLIELIECCMREYPVISAIVRGNRLNAVSVADKLDLVDLAANDQFTYWSLEKIQEIQNALRKKQEDKVTIEKEEIFFPVSFASTDFMAVRRDVFENAALMETPLFTFPSATFTKTIEVGENEAKEKKDVVAQYVYTEDEAFCLNLARAKIPLVVHAGLVVGTEAPVVL